MSRSSLVILAVLAVGFSALLASGAVPLRWGGPADTLVVRSVRSALDSGAVRPGSDGQSPDSRLASFYGDPDATLLWVKGTAPSDAARELLRELEALDEEGLDPELFGLAELQGAFEDVGDDPAAVAHVELQAAATFVDLAEALARGASPHPQDGLTWELEQDSAPGPELLARIAGGEAPTEVLDELRPTLPWYGRLVEQLARYRVLAEEGGWPSVSHGDALEPGDTGARVAEVRARLREGDDPREAELAARAAGAPDLYDPDLAGAVEHFQERHGIDRDGVVGPETVRAMNVSAEERVDELRLNLDRLRRMPRELGDRAILVNVAGFELLVLEENRPVLTMNVVVGKPENRTHVFADELEYLVFNPYWMVPASIVRDEIAPALRDDPSHLEANRFHVVSGSDPLGPPVDADEVDWSAAGTEDWPYVVRQEPGPGNSLGQVKFMFPNEHDIYLHDTPADHLFERTFRAFSHGCIRLERPLELARYVLRTSTDRPPSEVEALLASGERVAVDLDEPIPVYITYLTTWVGEDGTVRFHQDPYRLDEAGVKEVDGHSGGSGATTETEEAR